jgi:uncharacterized SAM-binding protein YcdF (DUF218 family)
VYFTLKAFARELLLPPAGPLIVAILGAWLIRQRRPVGWGLLAFGLALIWLFATPFVANALLRLTEHYPPLELTHARNAQAIVILGGGGERVEAPEYDGPAAGSELLERLAYGAFIAHRTGLPVLVSGAPAEALTMRVSLARDFGIEPRWIDARSRDTFENAHFSARILQPEGVTHVVLVTSSAHMWRATHEFLDAGFAVLPAPMGMEEPSDTRLFGFVPGPWALMRSHDALYELIGEPARLVQRALGLRERFDPAARPAQR